MRSIWMAGASLLCAAVCFADAPRGEPLWAVWKEQHVRFAYRGRTSQYSCEGLRERVRALLLDLGARRDLRVTGPGCASAVENAAAGSATNLEVVFSSLALRDDKAHPADAAVAALFEPFALTSDPFRNIGVADCELIQEFALQMLPKFATRNLQENIACDAPQADGGTFVVRGQILRSSPG